MQTFILQNLQLGGLFRLGKAMNLKKIPWLLLGVVFICLSQKGIAQTSVYQFDTPGTSTFNIPPGTTKIQVEAWGGGANGTTTTGGNGGNYSRTKMITPTGPILSWGNFSSISISVGGPGMASSASMGLTIVYANGGKNDGTTQPDEAANPFIETYYKGGTGGGARVCPGALNVAGGGGGGSAFANANGENGIAGTCTGVSNIIANPGAGGNGFGKGGNGASNSLNGENGVAPGGGGGSGSTSLTNPKTAGTGAAGRVRVLIWCDDPNPGVIGNAHTIVNPVEKIPDFVTNVNAASGSYWGQLNYRWQRSTDGSNWVFMGDVDNTDTNGIALVIPPIRQTTFFRRYAVGCGNFVYTQPVRIKVSGRNGNISGFVKSPGGIGVQGISITARKKIDLLGSKSDFLYSTVTGTDGSYNIPVFFGDPDDNEGTASNPTPFWIVASKEKHKFKEDSLTRSLSNTLSNVSQVDFVDETVFSLTGKVFQTCKGCLNASDIPVNTVISNLDGVDIFSQGKYQMTTRFLSSSNSHGSYAVTILDNGNYRIKPQLAGRKFVPDSTLVNVQNNVENINFEDTTTRVITGRITDGCGAFVGEATLQFQDVLTLANGRLRSSEFRKRVTTVDGYYSIRLPARKYRYSIISFSPATLPNPIPSTDFMNFFNLNGDSSQIKSALPYDSLLVDIANANAEKNLHYQRPPSLTVENLDNQTCGSNTFANFVTFPQSIKKPFAVRVWQGPASLGCPLNDDSVIINTNIQGDDIAERRAFKVRNGIVRDTLKGGVPKTIGNYLKFFNISYKDKYTRTAVDTSKKVLVTGVKSDSASSFATTSPEIPIMVLHDPPGDQSSSFWETSQTFEQAMSWSAASGNSTEGWSQIKLGTSFEAGLGVTTETSLWGTINSSINVSSTINNASEAILSTTTTQNISTSADEDVTGDAGDLFIGAAINLLYSRATEISLVGCEIKKEKRLMIANNGFGTQYVYTDAAIRDNVIPTLQAFTKNPGITLAEKENYENQIKVWQQVLENNEINKRRAAFDKNISFFGSSGPIANSTSTTATKTSTLEFNMEIEQSVAAELGFEIGGSGVSGGVNVRFRTEIGRSQTTTQTKSTTIGYTLDDNDALDNFSVNVRKDPVYNTPVFQTVAGQSSCPPEANTLPRDEPYFEVAQSQVTAPPTADAVFQFNLGNTSIDVNPRTYNLSFDQSSNPFGASISIGGIPLGFAPIPYSIGQDDVVPITVNVKRNQSNNAFTYEGLRFFLSDACSGEITKTTTISARFLAPCSDVNLVSPAENWLANLGNNNKLSIVFNNYVIANTQQVSMEFCRVGSNNWRTAFTRQVTELNQNAANGTLVDWDFTTIADGEYHIRLRLTCSSGAVYSQRVSGKIDRSAPLVLGVPQPSDYNYVIGDEISVSYNENITTSDLNDNKVRLVRLSNSALIPITVSGFENKLVVVPGMSLATFAGESFKLLVQNISDANGNPRSQTDSLVFIVGNFVAATGSRALQLTRQGVNSLPEGTSLWMNFRFALPTNATSDVQVNFSVGGTSSFPSDYEVAFSNKNRLNAFDGSMGRIIISRNQTSATLRIRPKADSKAEGEESIVLMLADGGDYQIGSSFSAIGTFTNVGLEAPVVTGPTSFCQGQSATLVVTHPEVLNPDVVFTWSNGATGLSITVNTPGTYTCTVKNNVSNLSGTSLPFDLTQSPLPNVNGGANFSITQNSGNHSLIGSPLGGTWAGLGVSGSNFSSNQVPGVYTLLYCATNLSGCSQCDTILATVTPRPTQAELPNIIPGSGSFTTAQSVIITTPTPGAEIYYTTNGNLPRFDVANSFTILYTGPFQISRTTTIFAIARKPGLTNSNIASATLTFAVPAQIGSVVFSPSPGAYSSPISISMATSPADAQIYYTTNGNNPRIDVFNWFTKLYATPINISVNTSFRAMGVKSGLANGPVTAAVYSISSGSRKAVTEFASAYPNPTSGLLHFIDNFQEEGVYNLSLTDKQGRQLKWLENLRNGATETIDLAPYSQGIYFLVQERNGEKQFFRIVKE